MQRLQTGKQTEHYYRKQELKCTNSYTHDVVPHRISARFLLHVEMELCLSRPQAVCREPGNKLNSHQGTWWCSLCCQSVWQRFNLPYLVQDLPGPLLGGLINLSSSSGGGVAATAAADPAVVVAHYIAQEVPADCAMRMPR